MFTNDTLEIGRLMIPATMSGLVGGWMIPSLVHYVRHVKHQIIFALFMQAAFTAAYAAVVPHNKTAWSAMQLFGQSCFTWVTTLAYLSSGLFVPVEELGVSAGLLGTFRSGGGSVGNAIFSTVLTSVVNRNLGGDLAAAAVAAGYDPAAAAAGALVPAAVADAVGAPAAFAGVSPAVSPAVAAAARAALRETYARGFRTVFYATIPFTCAAMLAAFWVRDPSHLLTNHVAVRQEREVLGRGAPRRETKQVGDEDAA